MSLSALLLPHFIIIGAMKSGTTTLYRHLLRHPEIDMSRDKETDFFIAEKNWNRGIAWYSSQFSCPSLIRGEASPNYTKARDFQGVPERIAATCPDVKLIFIARDPVQRAISQYRHTFIIGDLDPDMAGFSDSPEYAHILDASLYARQLDAYLTCFPEEAILVLDFDTLCQDPQLVIDCITDHIGAARHQISDMGAQNESAELSRVPAPFLRFAQSSVGRKVSGIVGRGLRDRIRGRLAFGRPRAPRSFPDSVLACLREDLRQDTARFRTMTGQKFDGWSL